MSRRRFLGLAGTTAAMLAVGGCGGSNATEGFEASRLFDSRALVPDGTPQRMVWAIQRNSSYLTVDAPDSVEIMARQGTTVVADAVVHVRRDGLIVPYYPIEVSLDSSDPIEFTFRANGGSWTSFAAAEGTGSEPLVRAGDMFPPVVTPTFASGAGVDPICTRTPEPCPFHEVSLDDALAAGRPTVLLLSTPAFCGNQIACGPALELLIDTAPTLGSDVAVIHAEIYSAPTGRDVGPVSPAMQASGAWFEPLLYAIRSDGQVARRIDFMWDRSELAEILSSF